LGANETSRTATGVKAGQKYYFRVAAYNDAGQSDWTYGEFEALLAPSAPSNLVFMNYSSENKTVQMSWTDNSNNETGFLTQYSQDGMTWKPSATLGANETSRTATGVKAGQKYYFRVAAYNDAGQSDWTYGEFEALLAPTAPSDLVFTYYSAESRSVLMSWTDNSTNESGFKVEYSPDGGATWLSSASLGANVTSRMATGLVLGRTYNFRVAAFNEAGQSSWTYGEFEASIVPAAPSDLVFGDYNRATKRLSTSWSDNSDNETGFMVEFSVDGKNWWLRGKTGDNQTFLVATGVEEGQKYYFRVASYNEAGQSEWTYGEFEASLIPTAPSDLVFGVYNLAMMRLPVSWTDNSDNETGFIIEYSVDGENWKLAGKTVENQTSRISTGVETGQKYYFRVAAYNAAGQSAWTYGVFDDPFVPSAPTDLVFTNYDAENRSVLMSWTDNSTNEIGFKVEYRMNDGANWLSSANLDANVTSRMASGLVLGSTYNFRIAAYNEFGQSVWTYGTFEALPLPSAPTDLVFTNYNAKNRSVLMSWTDNSTNESGFKVEYSIDGGITWLNSAYLGANVTSRTATGLVTGCAYDFRVAASNEFGLSKWTSATFIVPTVGGGSNAILDEEDALLLAGSNAILDEAFAEFFEDDLIELF
ncbi:MAG: fibronectin type III domain-containing protein, partial [Thermoguttaceae bacterium]|nr:fibronectin type III domain-containing protein [Thermoguttaceae bacterium]